MATITRGCAEGMTRSVCKARLRGVQQVLTTEQGPCITVPTMVFGGKEAPRFTSPHNNPLVVEKKIALAIVQRILIDTRSSVDIITWDCLKKLMHPGHNIVPLVHPILGFRGQEVNPTGMIRLPLRCGDKLKARNLEVDFLVIDVPTAYNVILGRPTLHKVKATSSNFNLRLMTNTWVKCMETEVYLLSIQPLVERAKEQGPDGPSWGGKRARARPPPAVP